MTKFSRLLLSAAILGGTAIPAFAQGAAPAVPHHHATHTPHVAVAHDVGAAAKSMPAIAAATTPKAN